MSEYFYDILFQRQIWYDLISNERDYDKRIIRPIRFPGQSLCYIRPHRENGPATIWKDGSEDYYIEGRWHREDGPAASCPNGNISWFLTDEEYYFDDWCEKLNKSPEEINFLKLKWNIV